MPKIGINRIIGLAVRESANEEVNIMVKRKTSPLVIALRVVLALTFMLKCVYTVQTQMVSMLDNLNASFGWLVALGTIMYGLISFALFWVVSALVYNNISISKYFPSANDGQCAVSRDKYLTIVYTVAIANNIVIGALNAMLYAVPVAMPFITLIASKIIAIVSVMAFNTYMAMKYAKGSLKEYTVAMALPSLFLIIVLGV